MITLFLNRNTESEAEASLGLLLGVSAIGLAAAASAVTILTTGDSYIDLHTASQRIFQSCRAMSN